MNVEMHKVNHIMIVPSPGDFIKEWGRASTQGVDNDIYHGIY
jgi:hypothetical protein